MAGTIEEYLRRRGFFSNGELVDQQEDDS